MPRKSRNEIFNIFRKLRKMFLRYDEQKAEAYTYMQASNRINAEHIRMDSNLRRWILFSYILAVLQLYTKAGKI